MVGPLVAPEAVNVPPQYCLDWGREGAAASLPLP